LSQRGSPHAIPLQLGVWPCTACSAYLHTLEQCSGRRAHGSSVIVRLHLLPQRRVRTCQASSHADSTFSTCCDTIACESMRNLPPPMGGGPGGGGGTCPASTSSRAMPVYPLLLRTSVGCVRFSTRRSSGWTTSGPSPLQGWWSTDAFVQKHAVRCAHGGASGRRPGVSGVGDHGGHHRGGSMARLHSRARAKATAARSLLPSGGGTSPPPPQPAPYHRVRLT
jgi:hypothetical protein